MSIQHKNAMVVWHIPGSSLYLPMQQKWPASDAFPNSRFGHKGRSMEAV